MTRATPIVTALVTATLAVLLASPACAHLTGVFAHFVEDINDPTASTRLLRQQLDSVGERLAALAPEVAAARMSYDSEAEAAVRRIRFYDIYAGSALGALWAGAQDPIDVIASSELLQRRLGDDLEALAGLSRDYEQLRLKESSLRRYADLLQPFSAASAARDERLSRPPPGLVSPFAEPYIAYRIAEDWEQLRGTTFVLYFHWAARRIADRGLPEVLVTTDETGEGWLLQEEVLNALVGGDSFPFVEDARFYLRADHINFSARLVSALDEYDLLTVGQLERTGPSGFQYRIEAIFVDGMPIDPSDPDVEREVYQGRLLGIDLDTVMPEGASVATFEQKNGALEFRFR
ncbi:MAG: hypothetical protein OEO82_12915 [Gammaproteobacteria bacterium]|nr:hypothetical protein [Gammaproteobacteria bacterium]